jgi:amino acid adenylation domain-containing protein
MTAGELLVLTNELGISLYLKEGNLAIRSQKGSLTHELKSAIKDKKSEIIALLSEVRGGQPNGKAEGSNKSLLTKRGQTQSALSYAQQRLWFLDQFEKNSSDYNMPIPLRISGSFDLDIVQKAIKAIIERHEVLRTVYLNREGEPYQQVKQSFDFTVEHHDISTLHGDHKEQKLEQLIVEESFKSFDLEKDLMVRACWIHLTPQSGAEKQEGVLLFNMHHIASDGWSMNVLVSEFNSLYQGFLQGTSTGLEPLKLQYSDYAAWQRDWLQGETLDKQVTYWKEQLKDAPLVHGLPLSYARPKEKVHIANQVFGKMPVETSRELLQFAKTHKVTPFMLLHAALALVFARNSNCYDIVLGTQVANRHQPELESLIGFFGNTLVLRANTNFEYLPGYIAHIRECNLEALSHQDIPFEQLVDHLSIPRNTLHAPLVQIIFSMEVTQNNDLAIDDLSVTHILEGETRAKFDIDISAQVIDGRFYFNWTYDTSIFSREYIRQLNEHLKTTLNSFVSTPELPLRSIAVLTPQEIDGLLQGAVQSAPSSNSEVFIHQLFEHQADQIPNQLAALCDGQQVTYSELNKQANQLAHLLKRSGVGPESLVGIYVDRKIEMLLGMLAVLKAGAAYVPMDTSFPETRLEYILQDANVEVVVTETALAPKLAFSSVMKVDMMDRETFGNFPVKNLDSSEVSLKPDNLAYVIYTSGSSGKPKGVAVEHRQIACRFVGFAELFDIKHKDQVPSLASYAFDISLLELIYPLTKGAAVNILNMGEISDLSVLANRLEQSAFIHMTPSLAQLWLDQVKSEPQNHNYPELRYFATGGDVVPSKLVTALKQQFHDIQVLQFYGPTEATLFCVCNQNADERPNAIGKVIPDTQGIIVGEHMELLPVGVVGELCLGGEGIARGYLNREELTQQQFVSNPFYSGADTKLSQRLYKTGDLVRQLPDGNIEYVSRKDNQIKIRGFRIELGEVQYHLDQCAGVHSSFALVKDNDLREKQLVAYIKREQESGGLNDSEFLFTLKATLGNIVPGYMIPSYFVFVDKWPVTSNAKVDSKLLPDPDWSLLSEFCHPENDIEEELVAIWSELLGIDKEKISIRANFFELGAHSLLVTRLVTMINSIWKINSSVRQVFERQTLKEQAILIEEELALYQTLVKKNADEANHERWEL